ncbi:hypothetical protein VCR4J2_250619 [Vibrio coralliirubri]|nr:hypothetical protein VCR4J2_250619 [Vibrio coralliirubri]CDT57951.1 hypothetical protein VCR29J2_360656 [Vibrio coralliirubri]
MLALADIEPNTEAAIRKTLIIRIFTLIIDLPIIFAPFLVNLPPNG